MSTNGHEGAGASGDGGLELSRKRQRMLSKSCETCKLKKSKCDSSRPQCNSCRRKGIECVYLEKGQPGLRPGYGKAIESRLTRLEENMEKISQSLQDVLNHGQTQYTTGPTFQLQEPSITEAIASKPAIDTHSWQTSQQLSEVAANTSPSEIEQLPSFLNIQELQTVDSRLPPPVIIQELVEIFLELIYPWVPLFNKANLIANLFSPRNQILLHGIVVVTFRYWIKPFPSADLRQNYIKVSREQILLTTIDSCTLISTQALVLLAVDAIGQGPGPRTWNIMAMLVTAAKHMGLAKAFSLTTTEKNTSLVRNEDPNDDELQLSAIEVEEKRRLFWTIYSLDRFSSIEHGQPSAIDTKSIKLPYPARDEAWGQLVAPEWFQGTVSARSTHVHCFMNLWHYNIDLLSLLDQSNQFLIQPLNFSLPAHCREWQSGFRQLDIALSTWFENLPREIRESPAAFNPMWTMVHATFHLIRIRMYTVASSPSTKSPYLRPSSSAPARCRQAIRKVAYLTSSLQLHELNQLGPIFAFVVWVAARSLIILWTKGYETTHGSLPADLEPLLSSLRQLAVWWPCAQRYNDIIQLILDTKNNPGGPTGLEIFNDTGRTIYGLQNQLGRLAGQRREDAYSYSLEFLEMDLSELTSPWIGTFGSEFDTEWL